MNFRHIFIVKVLHGHRGLTLFDPVDIGGENIAQLAQPLPVEGCFQFFLLDGQLSLQSLAQILDGLADGLALLAHGVLPVPGHIEAVQKRGEGLRLGIGAVLADGAEGKLLGGAVGGCVIIGCRVVQMLPEEKPQLFGHGSTVHALHSGIGIAGGKEGCLPADQRGETSQSIHQPVAEQVRAGGMEHFLKVLPLGGIFFGDGLGALIVHARQGGALGGLIQTHPAQAIDDPAVRA